MSALDLEVVLNVRHHSSILYGIHVQALTIILLYPINPFKARAAILLPVARPCREPSSPISRYMMTNLLAGQVPPKFQREAILCEMAGIYGQLHGELPTGKIQREIHVLDVDTGPSMIKVWLAIIVAEFLAIRDIPCNVILDKYIDALVYACKCK